VTIGVERSGVVAMRARRAEVEKPGEIVPSGAATANVQTWLSCVGDASTDAPKAGRQCRRKSVSSCGW